MLALLIILASAATAPAATGNGHGRHHRSHRALNAARHGLKRTYDHSRAPAAAGPSTAVVAAPSGPSPARVPTAPCANADLLPDPTNLPVAAAATLCLVNQVRAQRGVPPLIDDSTLDRAAQRHNDDMVARDYFAHDGPAGDTLLSRVRAAGYLTTSSTGYTVGENLAAATPTLATPRAIVNSWLGSPEHLANMLDPRFRDSGIAVAAATPTLVGTQGGGTYTQDFGGPSSG